MVSRPLRAFRSWRRQRSRWDDAAGAQTRYWAARRYDDGAISNEDLIEIVCRETNCTPAQAFDAVAAARR